MNKFILSLLILVTPGWTKASVLIEPIVGYEIGSSDCKRSTSSGGANCSGDLKGVAYGLRLGYKMMLGLWLAGEYGSNSSGKFEPTPAAKNAGELSADYTHRAFGLTVGFDIPFGFRVFGGYNFLDEVDFKTTAGTTKLKEGSGFKAGVGYKLSMIPIAFNIEYWTASYKKVIGTNGTSYNSSDLFATLKPTGFIANISFPITFP